MAVEIAYVRLFMPSSIALPIRIPKLSHTIATCRCYRTQPKVRKQNPGVENISPCSKFANFLSDLEPPSKISRGVLDTARNIFHKPIAKENIEK